MTPEPTVLYDTRDGIAWLTALAERWRSLAPGAFVDAVSDPIAALDRALEGPGGPVVVAGSLYLVGAVRGRLVDDPALRDG